MALAVSDSGLHASPVCCCSAVFRSGSAVPIHFSTVQGVFALDEFRQNCMIDALHWFGWGSFWRGAIKNMGFSSCCLGRGIMKIPIIIYMWESSHQI